MSLRPAYISKNNQYREMNKMLSEPTLIKKKGLGSCDRYKKAKEMVVYFITSVKELTDFRLKLSLSLIMLISKSSLSEVSNSLIELSLV